MQRDLTRLARLAAFLRRIADRISPPPGSVVRVTFDPRGVLQALSVDGADIPMSPLVQRETQVLSVEGNTLSSPARASRPLRLTVEGVSRFRFLNNGGTHV